MNIKFNNNKILVTGGAGFIGSNLCEALINKGNKVVCLDNFSTGKRENIEKLLNDPNFTLIEGDIRRLDDCLKAIKEVVKQLKGASKMHAQQAAKIERMLKSMQKKKKKK